MSPKPESSEGCLAGRQGQQREGPQPSFGPYYGNTCDGTNTDCECTQGTRSVAVRTVAAPDVGSVYSIAPSRGLHVRRLKMGL